MTAEAGVTHDVVLYAIGNNLDPIGLVVDGAYRVTNANTFVPRLAMGSATGADYTSFVSWVQNAWDGKSGANLADTRSFRIAENMMPTLPSWQMRLVRLPFIAQPDPQDWGGTPVYLVPQYNTTWNSMYEVLATPIGSVPPAVHNIATVYWTTGVPGPSGEVVGAPVQPIDTKGYTETRVVSGGLIYRAYLKQGSEWPRSSFAVCNSLSFSGRTLQAYDAVSYSTVAFVSTYYNSTYRIPTTANSLWNIMRVTPGPIVAHCYNTVYFPAGTTLAGALAVYDNRLWRASYQDKIAYYQPEQTTSGFWSAFTTVAPGIHIKRMCEFIGRLMIGATDGLYAYESGRTYKIVDLTNQISPSNFSVLRSVSGSLWFNVGQQLWRYTSGGLLEQLDVNFYLDEFPIALEGGDNCVFVLCSRRYENTWHLYRIDTNTGSTSIVGQSPTSTTYSHGSSAYGTLVTHDWLSLPTIATLDEQEVIDWTNADKFGESLLVGPDVEQRLSGPDRKTDVRFFNYGLHPDRFVAYDQLRNYGGNFRTGFITYGYPAAEKSWQRIVCDFTMPGNCTSYLTFGYRFTRPNVQDEDTISGYATVDASTWTYLDTVQATVGKNVIEFPPGVQSRQIELRVAVTANMAFGYGSIGINSLELDALYAGPADKVRRQHTFNAVIVNNLQLLNRAVENSAAWVAATLFSLADSGVPHVAAVPYPPPVGHTVKVVVELGAAGMVVPVMSYKHTIPGSNAAIVLREV